MTLNELAHEIHSIAKEKGWHDKPRNPLEVHMLIVSEIAEATEAVRANKEPFYYDGKKPEGELIELADALIRVLDYCGAMKWDIEKAVMRKIDYNKTRPYRHGNKSV